MRLLLLLLLVATPEIPQNLRIIEAVAPAQAVSAGFSNLVFSDDFDSLDIGFGVDGHKWNAGQWWENVPAVHCFSVANGVLTMTTDSRTSPDGVNLTTQYHSGIGGISFLGGYFEARMLCHDWSAFWLYDWKRPFGSPVVVSQPLTWSNEVDILETDPGSPGSVWCTLHKNTSSSGGVQDEQNNPDIFPMPAGRTINEWHIYGVLWTQARISWYVDDKLVASVVPYPSSWQLATLILGVGPGGVNGSRSDISPPEAQVDWVRVWR